MPELLASMAGAAIPALQVKMVLRARPVSRARMVSLARSVAQADFPVWMALTVQSDLMVKMV